MSRAEELRMEQQRLQRPASGASRLSPAGSAPRAIETAAAQAARRTALEKLLRSAGPNAIDQYVQRPLSAYFESMNRPTLEQFFKETSERIPKGTEMYRAPSRGEVLERLPRQAGATYRPGVVSSTASASDLQGLGELIAGKSKPTGGNQTFAPGLAKITAMTDLPGVLDVNEFLKQNQLPTRSSWNLESVLGPKTRYVVQNFTPGQGGNPPTWHLGAYANMGLGAANILGFLPMLLEAGRLGTGRMPTGRTNEVFPGANLLTEQDLIR